MSAARKIAKRLIAKAPPGWGETAMRRLKKQYPGEPEKAFATAWSLRGKGVSGEDYMADKSSSAEAGSPDREAVSPPGCGGTVERYEEKKKGGLEMSSKMLDEIVAKACRPLTDRIAKRKTVKQRARGTSVFQSTHPKVKDNKDHFPINDLAHAQSALARVMQYDSAAPSWYDGTLGGLQSAVKRAVYKKFPGLKSRKNEREKSASDRSATWSRSRTAAWSSWMAHGDEEGMEADIHVWAKPGDDGAHALYTTSVGQMALSVDMPLDETMDAMRGYLDDMALPA